MSNERSSQSVSTEGAGVQVLERASAVTPDELINDYIDRVEIFRGHREESESDTSSDSLPSLATTESDSDSGSSDSGHCDTWTFTPSIIEVLSARSGLGGVSTRRFSKVSYGFTEDMNSWMSSSSSDTVSSGLDSSDTEATRYQSSDNSTDGEDEPRFEVDTSVAMLCSLSLFIATTMWVALCGMHSKDLNKEGIHARLNDVIGCGTRMSGRIAGGGPTVLSL